MSNTLTTNSSIVCTRGGTVSPSSSRKLKVDGNAAITTSDLVGSKVDGCLQKNTDKSEVPCDTVATVAGSSESTKLKAAGESVLLDSLSAESLLGSPEKSISATAQQQKLLAI